MNKTEFLKQLDIYLKNIPQSEKDDIMADYDEYFTIGIAEGKTEAQLSHSLGSPKGLAKELIASFHVEKIESGSSSKSMVSSLFILLGIAVTNLMFFSIPLFLLLIFISIGWLIVFLLFSSPVLVILDAIVHTGSFLWMEFFSSIALCGVSMLLFIIMYYVTIFLKDKLLQYIKWNITMVKGGKNHD